METQNEVIGRFKKIAWMLSGENPFLLKKTSRKTQLWHYFIGFIMLLVITFILVSCFIFFHSLIQSIFVSGLLSFCVGLSLFNLYRLNVISFTSPTLPVNRITGLPIFLSRLFRYGIVAMLAFFVSQPIAIYLFEDQLKPVVEEHRKQELDKLQAELNTMFSHELKEIGEIRQNSSPVDQKEYDLIIANKKKLHQYEELVASTLIKESNYFIYKIQTVHEIDYYEVLFLQFFFIMVFLLPLFFKRREQIFGNLGEVKSNYHTSLVKADHLNFIEQQKVLLGAYTNEPVVVHDIYQNPPFNTILIEEKYFPQKEFIRNYRKNNQEAIPLDQITFYVKAQFNAKVRSVKTNNEDYQVEDVYELNLIQPTEFNKEEFDLINDQESVFSNQFFVCSAKLFNEESKEWRKYLLQTDKVKITNFELANQTEDIQAIHASISGELVLSINYREIDERIKQKYFTSIVQPIKEQKYYSGMDDAFPWLVKGTYFLFLSTFVFGFLFMLYQYVGNIYLYVSLLLGVLIYLRIKLHKLQKRKWINHLITGGIVICFILILAGALSFLYELGVHLLE